MKWHKILYNGLLYNLLTLKKCTAVVLCYSVLDHFILTVVNEYVTIRYRCTCQSKKINTGYGSTMVLFVLRN